ncbi:MAG: flagellar basal body L-ring protein FlgH [Syntrophobacteraceae bacterium]|nr:flagellar basal body L-ring protein FlgH [Desulfobacteraceae bacterium]
MSQAHSTQHGFCKWSRTVLSCAAAGLLLTACVTTATEQPKVAESMKATAPIPLTPLPQAGPPPVTSAPTGSLWGQSSNGSLFQDLRARKVGDVVTITVSESAKASSAATTTTNKTKSLSGNFSFAGAGAGAAGVANPKGAAVFGPYSGEFASGFKGDASTSKADTMTAYMTATVVDVMPNGNLVIRGSRWTKVNNDMEQIVLEGIVRPTDINRNNSVLSQNIAEAKIFMVGKGPVTQYQKPGWLNQLIDAINPF